MHACVASWVLYEFVVIVVAAVHDWHDVRIQQLAVAGAVIVNVWVGLVYWAALYLMQLQQHVLVGRYR